MQKKLFLLWADPLVWGMDRGSRIIPFWGTPTEEKYYVNYNIVTHCSYILYRHMYKYIKYPFTLPVGSSGIEFVPFTLPLSWFGFPGQSRSKFNKKMRWLIKSPVFSLGKRNITHWDKAIQNISFLLWLSVSTFSLYFLFPSLTLSFPYPRFLYLYIFFEYDKLTLKLYFFFYS